ncbi:Syntaxin-binding protein 5 [Merluccius polli]|uniref:Syntaxin-binding protein 5 n=1 Tax=Merluccius polli TaxID=89951 RepID=A0AA47MBQ6_MERPO|nr:Syntaxin-binding protein 5 [Merluccius polli]
MKKFNIRKVLDGLTAASSSSSASCSSAAAPAGRDHDAVPESLQSDHFQLCKTVRHGFPHQPSSMTFDPVQKILAVGTQGGALRLFGRSGVECYCQHESGAAVIQLQFLINEGALVSALADDSIHLWNLRQKLPAILHSLKFNRERITYCHLPFQSKWLYVGTERGNIHIVNVESFTLSGYVIMWNKAIELSTKTHPGPVVHISDNPMDEGKLLIGFECGIVVLWDLKCKKADYRYSYDEAIHSVAWHHEGKQFVCSHSDGTLTTWSIRVTARPVQTTTPHGKQPKDGKKPEPCKPILKVEYKTTRAGDPFMVLSVFLTWFLSSRDPFMVLLVFLTWFLSSRDPFMVLSGGLSYDTVGRRACLTVMHGKSTAVLEMDYPIVDFLTLCETPYPNDFQEPYAVVVLLEKDLVVIDLGQIGYPIFESPYPLSIHESPVTCCEYFADCPAEMIAALYSVGSRQKRQGYSKKEWPISGGNWGQGTQSYPEILITGHADGSIKFWDASALMLQVLYKLKTAKVFERARGKEDKPSAELAEEDPFAIQTLTWCPESRVLCVAGVSAHVIVYRFSKQEVTTEEVQLLEVRMQCDLSDVDSPGGEAAGEPSPTLPPPSSSSPQEGEPPLQPSTGSTSADAPRVSCLQVRSSPLKQSPGYQVDLVVQLVWVSGEPPQQITSLGLNSSYGLVVFGNSNGLAVVDYLQQTLLLNMGTSDLYSPAEPYQRQPRSPRKTRRPSGGQPLSSRSVEA